MKASTQTSWRTWRLGDLLKYEQPGRYLVRSTDYSERGKYPVLTAGKTFVLGYTNEPNGAYTDHPVIIFDDFTTASKYVDFDFKAKSSAMKMLTARADAANLRFVYERMQLIRYPIFDHKRRWIAEFSKLEIEAPELVEQTAIAEVAHDLADHIATLERLIAKKQAIKQGMMQQLLTGRTRLPGYTGEWAECHLGDVLTVRHGRNQRSVESPSGTVPILATGGQIGWADRPLYSEPSVLIGRKGTIDRPQYQDRPFWTVDTLFYTEISTKADPRFLFYLFQTIDWRSMNEASGVPSLSSTRIESVEVRLPGLAEQKAVREVLDDADVETTVLRARLAKARAIKTGMMQQLLTGRTRLPVEAAS